MVLLFSFSFTSAQNVYAGSTNVFPNLTSGPPGSGDPTSNNIEGSVDLSGFLSWFDIFADIGFGSTSGPWNKHFRGVPDSSPDGFAQFSADNDFGTFPDDTFPPTQGFQTIFAIEENILVIGTDNWTGYNLLISPTDYSLGWEWDPSFTSVVTNDGTGFEDCLAVGNCTLEMPASDNSHLRINFDPPLTPGSDFFIGTDLAFAGPNHDFSGSDSITVDSVEVDQWPTAVTSTGCTSDSDCNDDNACTVDSCDAGTGQCSNDPGNAGTVCRASAGACDVAETCTGSSATCPADGFADAGTSCADDQFCNGEETCDGGGACQAGTPPSTDDGVACTDDSCNEDTDSIDHTPNDAVCDNGLFCDGAETCDASLGCQAGMPPSTDDGVACTDDSCNEDTDSIDHTPNDAVCDDGVICNGSETCDSVSGCQPGIPEPPTTPCGDSSSSECNLPDTCDGAGNCDPNLAAVGTACGDPTDEQCNEPDTCDDLGNCSVNFVDEPCSDGDSCSNDDSCSNGTCVGDSVPACLITDQGGISDPNDFTLEYRCEGGNEVSITDATFTRNGNPLVPTDMSFSCPEDINTVIQLSEAPNDFSATVNINGIVGQCVLPQGDDITAVSFDLDANNNVVCVRGQGSAAVLLIAPLVQPPDDGAVVGGEYSTIDSAALMVAGLQASLSWLIPFAALAGTSVIIIRLKLK